MSARIITGDCIEVLRTLEDEIVQTCVTSPPYYGLRDYGVDGQIGLEDSPEEFVGRLVEVFREVRRVLRDDGTLWLNLGDSYAGNGGQTPQSGKLFKGRARQRENINLSSRYHGHDIKPKNLLGIPWRVAFALQADGWYLRQDIIWSKPNPMPESVTDRCTKAHEYLFLLSKNERYYFDAASISEDSCSNHDAGNKTHKGATAYENGALEHRTKAGLVSYAQSKRQQTRRAAEIAQTAGLTEAHLAAIRSVGITDTGKARTTQDGTGKNDAAVQALADEAKSALGGYYREFLIADKRNKRSVWTVATQPFKEAHFATFPPALIEPCILAGCMGGGVVLDPFGGAGTTALVADRLGRNSILIELNPAYADMARKRVTADASLFAEVAAQ